jgi:HEAT repeat protein
MAFGRLTKVIAGGALVAALLSTALACSDSADPPASTKVQVSPLDDREALRLLALIDHPDETQRRTGFQGLAKLGPRARAAAPGLTVALSNAEPRIRKTAAQVLGKIGAHAVPPLTNILETSSNPTELALACEALGLIGTEATDALPAIGPMVKEFDKDLRLAACLALGRIRAGAGAPAKTRTIEMEEGTTADFARAIVGASGNSAGMQATVKSVNPQPGQQRQLLEQFIPTHDLGPLGDEGKRKAVITITTGGDASVARAEVRLLVGVLTYDEEEEVRGAAAQALGAIGPGASEAVPDLVRALWDEDPVPENAAWALGEIGPLAKEAIPQLQQATLNSPALRAVCFSAIKKIEP